MFKGLFPSKTTKNTWENLRVLCEGKAKKPGFLNGRSEGNINVEFEGDESLINQFVNVTVTEPLSFVLKGEING